uniref:RAD51 interacting motif domain-containing protein n=1 Tax=Calidris pygmaea TaxID=425635 RepID=A0A8C3KIL5_9CHAR
FPALRGWLFPPCGGGGPPETESLGVWSAAITCENLQVLNPAQAQQNNSVEQNNKRNGDNELKKNSSLTPLNGDLFQMELLSHKSVSDKKWKQYQLLQIPFLCGTNSVFSHTEHEKNNFLKKVCSTEDKDCSNSDNKTNVKRGNKEKNNSSYIVPTLKPFKSIQPLEIPNFQLPSISNKTNSKMPSTNLKETDWKNFQGQPPLRQSKQIHGVQKMPEIGKQKLQNDKSHVAASAVGSKFREKNCSSISKQEHSTSAERGKVTYLRDKNTDVACNQIFAENYFEGKMLENSDGDDDEKSRICIYISAKNIQNEKCVSCSDLLKRMGKKSSNENAMSFPLQTSFPVITETLEKNQLALHSGVRSASSDSSLYEAESKVSTKAIFDFKRFLTENIIFESNCPHIIVQKFPNKKVSCNRFRGKEMFTLKFSFHNMLFGWARTWTESLSKDMPTYQGGSMTHQFHFCETLNEQCDAQKLVKSSIKTSYNNKICIFVLTIISKHLKVEPLKAILASFFNSRNTLLPTEAKSMQVENCPLSGRKQVWLNSCLGNTLRQNTEFHKNPETSLGFLSSTFVDSIGFEFHNGCQRRHFSRSLGEEESAFLKRGALFRSQKRGLCEGRHVRKHHLLPRGHDEFSSYLRSVSRKNGMKKQILVAKCLILMQGTFDCSSLEKMYCCNITKIQYLIGANFRFWSYFPGHSQLKLEKVNSKCTNQGISVTTVKLEKKKPSKMFNRERFKAFSVVLCENKPHETTGCRNCIKSTNEFINEVIYTTKKYLGTCSYTDADRKECVKSKELQINSDDFFSTNYFSIFDTYEKIPLTTDSEDFDQIPIVNQDNSVKKTLSEENAVTSSKKVHDFPAESNNVLILPEQSKTAVEKCKSLLSQDSQTNQPEYCKKIDTYSPHLVNKEKLEDQNACLIFENVFPGSSDVCQSVALPPDSSSLVSRGGAVSEKGHCRSPSSADKQKQSEKIPATVQYPSAGSPARADTYWQLQAKEAVRFSLQGHTQTNESVGSEPATLKQRFEYVKEQEEISDEQTHVTNESQCETVMNDLIMSYSEDESKTFIAAEEKLKMHLSVMNNGCLEDVKEKYLPLENEITYEFELKRKFDLVLEELHMFHEISKGNENNLSSLETNSHNNYCELNNSEGTDENATSVSQKKICISSPICGTTEGQNVTDNNENSLNENISNENEDQKVSKEHCVSVLSSEELLHSPVAKGKEPYTWDPAFLYHTLLKEQNYNLQKEGGKIIRVQPLKTCKGPIRIGLSRKARPKQLHPYLK